MLIHEIRGSTVVVPLDPETCLLLAHACRDASDDADDGGVDNTDAERLTGALYRALAATFEGYAMIGHAMGLLLPREYGKMTPATVRREWATVRPGAGRADEREGQG